ncbi:MAG: type II toxin-antitoxin system RelE/ParE family toxin [Coriobacteriales bacterium]|jgi:phage-related protein
MFEVILFEDATGTSPVSDFIVGLENRKLQAKIIGALEVLSEKGVALREPYSRHLGDGIFELRCGAAGDIARLLYFYHKGKVIVVTNGFVKKTRKTPPREIRLAKKRRDEHMARKEL